MLFATKIYKYKLFYEILEGFFCGRQKPANPCHPDWLALPVFSCPGHSIPDLGQWVGEPVPLLNFDTKSDFWDLSPFPHVISLISRQKDKNTKGQKEKKKKRQQKKRQKDKKTKRQKDNVKCICLNCKIRLSKSQNVSIQIGKCICTN